MLHRGSVRYFTKAILICFFLSAVLPSQLLAHSGHEHENKLQISLPDVLAKVNQDEIKSDVIARELGKSIENYTKRGMPLTAEQEKSAAQKLLQDEIGRVLLTQKAKALGLEASEDVVEKKLSEVKQSFRSEAIFEHKLKDEGLTLERYRKELKVDLSMEALIKKDIEPNIETSPEEIKTYYEKHVSQTQTPEMLRASVILIKLPQDASAKSEKLAEEKINSIREQIVGGADFAALAKRFSQDSLAHKGGDLGYFTKEQMFPAFGSRAFQMKVGEVSEVFKTGHGLHLLKVTDRKPGGTPSLEQETENIRKVLIKKKSKTATLDYIEELKKQADIKVYF